MASQQIIVEDFSGGVTDYYLSAPPNKMRTCDNLLLTQYQGKGKPFTRPGCELYSSDAPRLPTGNQRISTAFLHQGFFFNQSATQLYYFNTSAWSEVVGPTSNPAFPGATTSNYFTYAPWNAHVFMAHSGQDYPKKLYVDDTNTPLIIEAGLPKISSSGITLTPTAGANTYLYKFVYRQIYATSGSILFTDIGAPSAIRTVSAAAAPNINPVVITTIPVLSNSTTSNFKTASILVDIYRTVNAGTTFYYTGSITNGTTSYNDTVSDANLITSTLLYTEGGVVANDRPPKCKLVHVSKDNIGYYGNIIDSSSQTINYRVLQSIPGDIDSVPETFFVDMDDEVVGLSSTKSNVVALCRKSAYRIDGAFDELGRGGMTRERISDTAGCISAQSVVQALDGVFWAGRDGIYFTDGFRVMKLNQDYDKSYADFTNTTSQCERIQGKYDKKRNRIWWTIQNTATDVELCYVLDLNWGVTPNAAFTTVSGGTSFRPTAIEFDDGVLLRCDLRGYVFKHTPTISSDLLVDTTVTATSWTRTPIIYDLETIATDFGVPFTRKYVTGISVTCEAPTNLSLQVVSNNDDSRVLAELSPIRYRGLVVWGDPDVYWGDVSISWNKLGLINQKRLMPAGSLRCNFKSIRLTNASVAIINSDSLGVGTVDGLLNTLTLDNTSYTWPTNSVGYFVSLESDGYVKEYEVTARTATKLTFTDTTDSAVSASGTKWVLRGVPKGEILNLLSFSLTYAISGPTFGVFKTSETGEVGT